jgi:two-component system sensor histidine kinase DevS
MAHTRYARFSLVCLALWCAQALLMAIALWRLGPLGTWTQRWWELSAWGASAALGGMLVAQVGKAWTWRPRRSRRASPELLAERRRIARELHDQLGAPLVFAQSLTDPANPREHELRMVLERCLLAARLIVDDMDGSDAPFVERLAQLRYRIAPVLDQRGIRLVWDVPPLAGTCQPAGESTRHLMAIIEESLSNALQHAGATEMRVQIALHEDGQHLQVEVCDNGRGMPPAPDAHASPQVARGKGLAGLARRARLAGANLDIGPGAEGGTCVRLTIACLLPAELSPPMA